MKTLDEQVIAIITDELRYKDGIVTASMLLKEDLDMQSLDAIELLMALEDKFGIEFASHAHDHVKTVQDIIDATRKLIK
jgi:acyl carrier protein